MKLSTKGRYGLRALIDLAQYSSGGPVSTASISARQDISERYLEQLMSMMKKAGLVKSIRGAGGGYVLAKDMCEISVGDVLRALEGSLEPVDCAGLEPEGMCSASDSCVAKYVWQRINESINRTVDEIRLDQLVDQSRRQCGAPCLRCLKQRRPPRFLSRRTRRPAAGRYTPAKPAIVSIASIFSSGIPRFPGY